MNPIILNTKGLNDLEIEAKLRLLADAQTENPTAAPGVAATSAVLTAAADLIKNKRTAQKTAEAAAEAATAQKHEAAAAGKVLISDYAAEVWPATGKDVAKCVLLAFDVSGGGGSPPPPAEQQITGLELNYGPNAGSLTVKANAKPARAVSIEAQVNLTPNAAPTWQHADIFSSTPFTLTGLPSGALVQVRVRAVFAGGVKGPWSDIAEHRVP